MRIKGNRETLRAKGYSEEAIAVLEGSDDAAERIQEAIDEGRAIERSIRALSEKSTGHDPYRAGRRLGLLEAYEILLDGAAQVECKSTSDTLEIIAARIMDAACDGRQPS